MEKSLKKYFPIFAGPTLIAFLIAFIVPFFMGLYLSFTKFSTLTDATWVGTKNYANAPSGASPDSCTPCGSRCSSARSRS